MSSPSKSQPSHAAMPDFHCCGERSRKWRTSGVALGAVVFTAFMLDSNESRHARIKAKLQIRSERRKHCAAMFSARVAGGGRRSKPDASARLTRRRWYAARTAQRTAHELVNV